ncbi:tail fiber domain-containing protein [Psychroserpens ponticola]|uniref:Tail fiber domain-containing protein n=1 Tax=Psychroserpens ponticola TaxID=2932268 RepID=A0ABY7RWP8_9FLAO|nr:tail fiber domain-containing protein [Psychroserpens ponticola]WCO00661.1 tail fiber domain-containing protein [Psychroserpens ponticola]
MKPLQYLIVFICFISISNSFSQVGIGTTSPDASSVLDIVTTDKGLLIPRVNLPNIATTMLDGTNTAATSLLIYNINAAVTGGNGIGYYYFNGTIWEKLITSGSNIEKIDDLIDGKSDSDGTQNGSSIYLGINSGLNDDSSDNKNVGIGFEAMITNISGYNNSTIGYQSLYSNTTGSGNAANGFHALTNNTVGNWNVANGYRSLFSNIGGNNNTANGNQSLFNNTNGYNNSVNGYESMYSNLTGHDNTASGLQSLYSNTFGGNNTAFGVRAMYLNINGSDNAATGDRSLYSNTSGRFNTANGSASMSGNTSGDFNTASGYQSLLRNTQGNNNTANGSLSMFSNTLGHDNAVNGFRALYYNLDGDFNTASGSFSLFFNSTGNQNIGLGHESLFTNTTGSYNIGIGSRTGSGNSTGSHNIYLGHNSGTPETGSNKLYIENSGANSDNALIYGEFDNNILRTNSEFQIGNPIGTGYAFPTVDGSASQIMQTDGSGSISWVNSFSEDYNDLLNIPIHNINNLVDGKSDNDGTNNGSSIFLGVNAGLNDDSSNNGNIGVGFESLMSNSNGNTNTAIGHTSMYNNLSGSDNAAFGFWSLYNNRVGDSNTALGVAAGFSNFYGSRNVFLGTSSGSTAPYGDGNIFIGYTAGQMSSGDDKLYIENSNADADNALIYGEFDNNILRINGELQLGDSLLNRYAMPTSDGNLDQLLQTDGAGNIDWVDASSLGSDDQNLNGAILSGYNLEIYIENGNSASVDLSSLVSSGDITGITAGDGLTGSALSGAPTLDVVAINGLTAYTNSVVLGGTLTQATTITQGTNNLTFDLNSSGDFIVQDNGINHFEVSSSGLTYFGDDTWWNDGSTTGTTIASLVDEGNNGRFRIYENGVASVDLDANTGFIFNEQGLDRDFRIESDDETSMFIVDAGNNRIGIMEATPNFDIHLKQSSNTEGGVGGIGFESSVTTNNWKLYHSGANFSFAENGVRRAYIATTSGLYMDTSDRRLKKSITEVEFVLDRVNNLKAYRYLYKDQEDSGKKILGFMAQDVEPLFPELVGQAEDGYLALNYAGFGVVAIKAIQEQQQIIDAQQQQIETLQKSESESMLLLNSLLKRIENLENQD